jgi:SPP1 gp7 family putative phage head morphogenesis protein
MLLPVAVFNMPPEEAVAYLKAKGYKITFNWQEMLDEAHAQAFTVAKATKLDILKDIGGAVTGALEKGETFDTFLKNLAPTLQKKGWWGKDVVVDPDTLDAQLVQLGSNRRLKTIYQTNLQSAYMAARCKAQMQAKSFVYLMYVAVMDSRTRPGHAALHGRVFRKDDPMWQVMYPPNGFNCRCRTRALTEGQVAAEGLKVESSAGKMVSKVVNAGVDKVTGEVAKTTVNGIQVQDPVDGSWSTMWVDPGFNSSPCNGSPIMDELLYKKAEQALADQAVDFAAEIIASGAKQKVWQAFVSNVLMSGVLDEAGNTMPQGKMMTLGVASKADLAWLEKEGVSVTSPLFTVADKALTDSSLTLPEWDALPSKLLNAKRYWDAANQTIIYAYPVEAGQVIKVSVDYKQGSVLSATKVDALSLAGLQEIIQ